MASKIIFCRASGVHVGTGRLSAAPVQRRLRRGREAGGGRVASHSIVYYTLQYLQAPHKQKFLTLSGSHPGHLWEQGWLPHALVQRLQRRVCEVAVGTIPYTCTSRARHQILDCLVDTCNIVSPTDTSPLYAAAGGAAWRSRRGVEELARRSAAIF